MLDFSICNVDTYLSLGIEAIRLCLQKIYEIIPFQFPVFNGLIFCVACILLLCNIIGLLPYSVALTSQFIFAFYFSIIFFVSNILIGCLTHGSKFFGFFLPDNIPT